MILQEGASITASAPSMLLYACHLGHGSCPLGWCCFGLILQHADAEQLSQALMCVFSGGMHREACAFEKICNGPMQRVDF